jgi:two-component sensor histidine kinase
MSWAGSGAPIWDAEHLRIATDAAGVALWSWNVDTNQIALDDRALKLWDARAVGPITFEALSVKIHPEDLHRVRTAFEQTRDILGAYEIDFRILHSDETRWISARGQGEDRGIVGRIMFGVFLDVTDRKQAEETRELLAAEMHHRIKNLFAIADALTGIAARTTTTVAEMARDLKQRLGALRRAQDLVQTTSGQVEIILPLLGNLFSALLAPYADDQSGADRVHVFVPGIPVGATSMTTLAMVMHELATNSIKYGALLSPAGTLDISSTVRGDEVLITWTERGGPRVEIPGDPPGFGNKLVTQSIGHLGGTATYDWLGEGVVVTLRLSKARLAK